MARQGGFKQCCPSAACEGSLGGQRGQLFCWSLTFTAQALVPAGLGGSRAPEEDSEAWLQPVHVTEPQLTSENWILCSYLHTMHTDSLLFPSLPKPLICWGHPLPVAMQPLHARFWAGTGRNTREVGWGPAWFLFSQPWKLRAIPLILMRLCWYEPEGTKSVAEFGLCHLMAQPE